MFGFNLKSILFLGICCSSLQADLDQYFKKAEGKSDIHQMRNIDFIYVLNLDQRPEKFEHCVKQLAPYGITPYRFSAVNGWELSLETVNDVGVKFQKGMEKKIKNLWGTSYLPEHGGNPHHEILQNDGQTYFCHCMSKGAVGIVLSHLSILQDAYDSGYETIWVMEDDIEVIRDPHIISDYIDELDAKIGKNRWDVLFTDRDTKNQNGEYVPCTGFATRPNFTPRDPRKFQRSINIGTNFRLIGARYGAYSMIVRRSGMKKILDFIKTHHIFLPYDMDNFLAPNINLISVQMDIVSTLHKALSDNGGPNYLKKTN